MASQVLATDKTSRLLSLRHVKYGAMEKSSTVTFADRHLVTAKEIQPCLGFYEPKRRQDLGSASEYFELRTDFVLICFNDNLKRKT